MEIMSIIQLCVDIDQVKQQRASSYIETLEQFKNSKLLSANYSNNLYDHECFRWCMLYHQSESTNNCERLSVLIKVRDTYSYDGINFRVSYDDIETSEDVHTICVIVHG